MPTAAYIHLDTGWVEMVAEPLRPVWLVMLQFDDHALDRYGPSFRDASDAVNWAQQQGAEPVFIDIEDSRLWAGKGPPPLDMQSSVFLSLGPERAT